MAYRQFMKDLATVLANDTSAIEQDVADMYALEKDISQVRFFSSFLEMSSSFCSLIVSLERCRTTSSRQ